MSEDKAEALNIVLNHAILCGHERAEFEEIQYSGHMSDYDYQCLLKNHITVINKHRKSRV
jgi:hypothetical protein